jgi:hypothetical protein
MDGKMSDWRREGNTTSVDEKVFDLPEYGRTIAD